MTLKATAENIAKMFGLEKKAIGRYKNSPIKELHNRYVSYVAEFNKQHNNVEEDTEITLSVLSSKIDTLTILINKYIEIDQNKSKALDLDHSNKK